MSNSAVIYYCPKLRVTTWDPEICKKRKAAGRKAQVKPGSEPSTFWPCVHCKEKLIARPCFTCARCGISVAGYDKTPPPSWVQISTDPDHYLCQDCAEFLGQKPKEAPNAA